MGFGRFIFKTVVPGGHLISTIKNVVDEGSIVDGVKKTYQGLVIFINQERQMEKLKDMQKHRTNMR